MTSPQTKWSSNGPKAQPTCYSGSVPTSTNYKEFIEHDLKLKNVVGIKTSISGPTISHVMYADDIVFSKASRKDVESLVKILEKYCRWSGQVINRRKSGVFFLKAYP